MKKVLFTATVDSHIELFHVPFLKYFKENGYEVHVATNGNNDIPFCDKKFKIPFERSPFKLNNLKAIKKLKKIINTENYDVIHTHTPMGSVVTRLAALKSRKKNHTRVIYTAHGFHFYDGAPLLNWLLFYPVEKFLSKYTDTLILINKEDYNLAKRKFKKCRDIMYVPGVGIDEAKFGFTMNDNEKSEFRKSLGLNDNDFVMIYPAELNKNKNQLFLINALEIIIKKYPNIHLLLAGKDSYNGFYQKLVNDKCLNDNIHFLGFRKDIPKLLKISDISISTSLREGLPVNIMEAMYAGLPVVATDCRGNRDLIKNERNGYIVSPNDINSLIKGIKKLYKDKSILTEISKRNKDEARKYLLDSIMDNMKDIYEKKPRVLHILASNSFSGAENVACTIIKELESDFDMIYSALPGAIEEALIERGIDYELMNKLSRKNVKNIIEKYKPDIIHAHDFKASLILSTFNYSALKISHIHQNPTWFSKLNIKTILYYLASLKMDKIAFVSNAVLDEFVFKNKIKDKVITISNHINRNIVLSKALDNFDGKFDVCYFGRLSKEKNPIEFIEIIKLYIETYNRPISACMVGDGDLKNMCYNLIKEYNLEDCIKILGFQKNPYKIINRVKCVIMPSIYEGFGLAAVESICLNKPVLNSGAGGLKEIFKHNEWLICRRHQYVPKLNYILKNGYNETFDCILKNYTDLDIYKKNIKKLYK